MVAAPPRAALTDIEVVPMRRRHVRGVMAVERLVYPRPWSATLFTSELAQCDSRRYVVALAPQSDRALFARKVVGYAGVMVTAEAHITTVAVHPEHHRQKIATHLLLAILDEARAMGAEAAALEVRVANRGAQRLYSGFGFAPVGMRPGYYAETSEDALIMWAHDLQSEAYGARLQRQRVRLSSPGGASGAPDHPVPWVKGRIGLTEVDRAGRGGSGSADDNGGKPTCW
ncbi:MAG: ribosomal-protein-alanine N-acetyltransferase [Nitriliruptorales bacterium]|nr:ribosomal-protein-alanine N-acetyltransferase [Nitriliruptorales bacterium]